MPAVLKRRSHRQGQNRFLVLLPVNGKVLELPFGEHNKSGWNLLLQSFWRVIRASVKTQRKRDPYSSATKENQKKKNSKPQYENFYVQTKKFRSKIEAKQVLRYKLEEKPKTKTFKCRLRERHVIVNEHNEIIFYRHKIRTKHLSGSIISGQSDKVWC